MKLFRPLAGLFQSRTEDRDGPRRGQGPNLAVLAVDSGGCGLSRAELRTLLAPRYALERHGLSFVDTPLTADILLVTGPVSTAMAPELRRLHAAIPNPKWVLAIGDCTRNGCVFQSGYAVHGGLGGLIPVDLHVPGCPPRPEAILEGLLRLKFVGAQTRAETVAAE